MDDLSESFERGAYAEISREIRAITEVLRGVSKSDLKDLECFRGALMAIETVPPREEGEDESPNTQEWIFRLICLAQLVKMI